jgi:hypothetical protein
MVNGTLLNFGERYKDDLRVIFDQWPKLHLGLNALSNQKILNGVYYILPIYCIAISKQDQVRKIPSHVIFYAAYKAKRIFSLVSYRYLSRYTKYMQCTEVRFTSFLSGGFTTMTVILPPVRKLAKCTSVQWFSVHDKLLFCVFVPTKTHIPLSLTNLNHGKKSEGKKKLIQQASALVFVEKFLSFCLNFC